MQEYLGYALMAAGVIAGGNIGAYFHTRDKLRLGYETPDSIINARRLPTLIKPIHWLFLKHGENLALRQYKK